MNRPRRVLVSGMFTVVVSSIGCSCDSLSAPDSSAPGPAGATIAITASGLSPNVVTIGAGQSVTFINSDSVVHDMASTPVPTYSDCPPVNRVGRLEPGQSTQTGALTTPGSCGFLDISHSGDNRWQGTIVIQ